MFERMTDRGRRVVVLAQEEARMLNHNYIGTEHVLLGLLREGEGVACLALQALGADLGAMRKSVIDIIGMGEEVPSGHIPFTPRAKKVLEFSLREGLQLGHNYIGTEHILLGLIREGEGVGSKVLAAHDIELTKVRQQVIYLLSGGKGSVDDAPPPQPKVETTSIGSGGAGGSAKRVRVSVRPTMQGPVTEVADEVIHWLDLHGISGNKVAVNMDLIACIEEDRERGRTFLYYAGGSSIAVTETIAEIWEL